MFELTYWFCCFGAGPVLSCIAQSTRSTACPQTEPRRSAAHQFHVRPDEVTSLS